MAKLCHYDPLAVLLGCYFACDRVRVYAEFCGHDFLVSLIKTSNFAMLCSGARCVALRMD
jgi:hypothetical protein